MKRLRVAAICLHAASSSLNVNNWHSLICNRLSRTLELVKDLTRAVCGRRLAAGERFNTLTVWEAETLAVMMSSERRYSQLFVSWHSGCWFSRALLWKGTSPPLKSSLIIVTRTSWQIYVEIALLEILRGSWTAFKKKKKINNVLWSPPIFTSETP